MESSHSLLGCRVTWAGVPGGGQESTPAAQGEAREGRRGVRCVCVRGGSLLAPGGREGVSGFRDPCWGLGLRV